MSSPHTRGSSSRSAVVAHRCGVLPAHAGVFLADRINVTTGSRPPRTRGGLPTLTLVKGSKTVSSPHTRGSSRRILQALPGAVVLPAHAGVFLCLTNHEGARMCPPRTRGGLPNGGGELVVQRASSPHTRGSSLRIRRVRVIEHVLPAHAGVFRCVTRATPCMAGPPRTRGGLPATVSLSAGAIVSSPHTRGSSLIHASRKPGRSVLPAHAGVFPTPRHSSRNTSRPPRTRGGLPADMYSGEP